MDVEKSSYRNIAKGTAIFGGVQVFQMVVNILRGKFIALLLGPAGMGVSALLTSTMSMINQFSSLGLNLGAMRDISMANEAGDAEKLSIVAKVFRRLVFATGILGALVSTAGAKWWSRAAFGNTDYTWAFVVLGGMSLLTALGSGETALLQGTRRLKSLARTSLFGSIVGLVVGVPMYYFWGTAGIAPAMVALAAATYLSNRYFTRQMALKPVAVTNEHTRRYAKSMITLGVTLTVAGLLGTLSTYFIHWFIRYTGNLDDVGLYQSATSITTQYIGFVFSAMAMDYFPRLAAISEDKDAVRKSVNQQGEMIILIAAPIIVALLATAPLVVRILLSAEFMPTIPVVRWMGFALLFKASSFALGYISFAKGDKRTFFWLEGVIGNVLIGGCAVIGYVLWGYTGLGVAMLATYVIYFLAVSAVAYRRYDFRFDRGFLHLFAVLLGLCGTAFGITFFIADHLWCGLAVGGVLAVTGVVCWRELNKRMDIKSLIKSKLKHRNE
jgi:O-antigen/teichoic acid export membrane protein